MKIRVNFDRVMGEIKPVNGVNNGPVCYGGLVDLSDRFREAQFPYSRLHDPNWPHPYEVDIHTIFPDFSKDPSKPESYSFQRTDEYIASIKQTGADIVYRLGESIEHGKTKYHVYPPEDNEKWAQICLGIIRHMNDGWADGHHFNIRYWEIWNEPDNPSKACMWNGTDQQYFDLYAAAATAIKAYDKTLKVGGFAATMVNEPFLLEFLAQCRDRQLPLDFFSWHTYAQDVSSIVSNARKVRKALEEYGFGDAESHLNEWNYAPIETGVDASDVAKSRRYVFEAMHDARGMSFDAAVMLALLDESVDVANFYDVASSSLWGLFDPYGVPYKSFFAFKAFAALREGLRVSVEKNGSELYCAASRLPDSRTGRILISNPSGTAYTVALESTGTARSGYCADENSEWKSCLPLNPSEIEIPAHSIYLLELEAV